jgi:RecB family endonuclease NucS
VSVYTDEWQTIRPSYTSTAEAGAYLLIIKRDGSLQIHHPKGIKPMNWQPKTDSITARVKDGFCVLTASRNTPAETVRVVMLDIRRNCRPPWPGSRN